MEAKKQQRPFSEWTDDEIRDVLVETQGRIAAMQAELDGQRDEFGRVDQIVWNEFTARRGKMVAFLSKVQKEHSRRRDAKKVANVERSKQESAARQRELYPVCLKVLAYLAKQEQTTEVLLLKGDLELALQAANAAVDALRS